MAFFDINNYQTAQERLDIFWRLYPSGRISNDIVLATETEVVVRSSVFTDRNQVAPTTVDYAQEPVLKDGKMAGLHYELAVTSATARAISMLGGELSPDKKRATQSEMLKAGRSRNWKLDADNETDRESLLRLLQDAKDFEASEENINYIISRGKALKEMNPPAGKELTAGGQG
jgi:hypothetical protein